MKRFLFFFAICLLTVPYAMAQQVSGRVTESESGKPMEGVAVVVKNTTVGILTDADGNYRLNVPAGANTLLFKFVGRADMELSIDGRSVVDVEMLPEALELDEVVVTAFGISREKKALSYAVQEVEGDVIQDAFTQNVTNALQGKIAGVIVQQSGGMPGASSSIRIRGSNSFTSNNQPLYVIDGVPVESNSYDPRGNNATVSGFDASSRAIDINPEDIESVSVLKGASAAALYGLRASNGVILITTKSGKNMVGTEISVSQTLSFDQVSRLPELQSTYGQGISGRHGATNSTSWGPKISEMGDPAVNPLATGDGSTYVNNVGLEVTPQVYDNVNPMFQTGHTSNTTLGIRGNSNLGNYAISLGYTDQEGIIPNTGMNRINTKFSGELDVFEKFTTGINLNLINTRIDKLAGGSNLSNVLFTTYWAPRSYDLWGTQFAADDDPFSQVHYRGAMDNPRWSLENNFGNEDVTRTFGSVFASYKPADWISVNYRFGADVFSDQRKEVYALGSGFTGGRASTTVLEPGVVITTVAPSGGQITDRTYNYQQLNSNFNVAINKVFGDNLVSLDVLLGNEFIDITTALLEAVGTGVTIGGFNNISNTSTQQVTQLDTRQRQIGTFANASVGFKGIVFLNLTGRYDRVSNLPSGNRDFFYPSAGLTFALTEIPALQEENIRKVLSFAKVRFTYAEVGQAPDELFVSRVPFVGTALGTGFTNDGIVFPFAGQTGFQQSITLRDPNLEPQNTQSLEAGLQVNFFENRIGFDVTYFNDNTTGQIFAVPLAASTGYFQELRNAGEMRGSGWEVAMNVAPVVNENFSWDFMVNLTTLNNEVVSLEEGVESIYLGGFTTPQIRAEAGSQYPIIFGSRYLRDDAGNIIYDSRQFINGVANPQYGYPITNPEDGMIGDVTPDFIMGFSNSFNIFGVTVGAHFDLTVGGQAYAGNTRLQKLYGQDIVTEDREVPVVLDGMKGYLDANNDLVVEGVNDIVVTRGQDYFLNYADNIDESNVYDTDFLRFRELNISYALPASSLDGVKFIKGLSISASARNIALWTSYPNFDPETSLGGQGNFQGLEYVNLPQARSYGLGVNLTF